MILGYARVSTTDQDLTVQLEQLKASGCEKIFQEKASAKSTAREEFQKMMELVETLGSNGVSCTVIAAKLDRVARSTADLLDTLNRLNAVGAKFRALNAPEFDTTSATGELMMTILGAIATFERKLMLERQAEGIARAKAEGKYKGRAATAQAKADDVIRLANEGKGATEIAKTLDIGRASVYRILKTRKTRKLSAADEKVAQELTDKLTEAIKEDEL